MRFIKNQIQGEIFNLYDYCITKNRIIPVMVIYNQVMVTLKLFCTLLFVLQVSVQQEPEKVTLTKTNLKPAVTISVEKNSSNSVGLINKNIKTVQEQIPEHKEAKKSAYNLTYDRAAYDKMMGLCSFDTTMQTFPFLEKNMKASVLAELHVTGDCYSGQLRYHTVGFAILDNKAYIVDKYDDQDFNNKYKNKPFVGYLNQVLQHATIPDTYFLLNVVDVVKQIFVPYPDRHACRALPLFVFNKNTSQPIERNKFLIPDLYIINGWDGELRRMKEESAKIQWKDKKNVMFFRGLSSTPNLYQVWLDQKTTTREQIMRYHHRGGLALLSIEHPDKIDAKFSVSVSRLEPVIQKMVGPGKNVSDKFVPLEKQLTYKFLISVDGGGAAWRRVQSFLASSSVLVKPFSDIVQWFYDKLIPEQNFIMPKVDLSDILDWLDYLSKEDEKCINITKNANAMVEKYLTPEAIDNYTVENLRKYAKIQKLNLTKEQKDLVRAGGDLRAMLIENRKAQMNDADRGYMREWVEISSLASLEGTISKFPFLKDGLNPKKIADLILNKKCGVNLQSFAVLNNTVIHSTGKPDEKSKWLLNLLTERTKAGQLPDMYFLYSDGSDTSQQNLDPLCKELPVFTTVKSMESPLQQTRFLLPDLDRTQRWSTVVEQAKKQNEANKWEKKEKKAYFIGKNERLAQQLAGSNINLSVYGKAQGIGLALLSQERPELIEARLDTKIIEASVNKMGLVFFNNSNTADQTPKFRYQILIDQHNDDKLQQLMFSSSVVMMPLPKRVRWIHSKISPNIHFVPLASDLSDCFSKIMGMNKNETIAKQVFQKANLLSQKQLNQKIMENQIVDILRKYSTIQQWLPNEQVKQKIINGAQIEDVLQTSP